MPPIAPSKHLTSCITVRAAEYASEREIGDESPHLAPVVVALMSVIGDRFARYLPPNFCVQLRRPVMHNELRLFLAPAMRNLLTMCHVFKMQLEFIDGRNGKADSEDELKLLFSAMRSKLTYITQLEVILGKTYTILISKVEPLCTAMFASLPASLRSISLKAVSQPVEYPSLRIGSIEMRALASMQQLQELRMVGNIHLTQEGLNELFRADKPTAPAGDDGQACCFFPKLLQLEAPAQEYFSYVDFVDFVSKSVIFPQLFEFCVDSRCTSCNVDVSTLKQVLGNLSHIRVLGDNVLTKLILDGPLDLSPLSHVRCIGRNFLSDMENTSSSNNNSTIDLSSLTHLETIGACAMWAAKITDIVFPPNVMHIEAAFCSYSSITKLDLAPISHSLQTINLSYFASFTNITQFDSSSLAGKIITGTEAFLAYCCSLVDVDLSGLRGVRRLDREFLYGCPRLVRVRAMDALKEVDTVAQGMLHNSASLVECDFGQMVSLRNIEDLCNFLAGAALRDRGCEIVKQILAANNV